MGSRAFTTTAFVWALFAPSALGGPDGGAVHYKDAKTTFAANFLGPLVQHPAGLRGTGGYGRFDWSADDLAIVLAPGVQLISAKDRAAAVTVLLDIKIVPHIAHAPVSCARPASVTKMAPERIACGALSAWRFKNDGSYNSGVIRSVPVTVLLATHDADGRVDLGDTAACRNIKIARSRSYGGGGYGRGWGGHSLAEIQGDGTVAFEGTDAVAAGKYNAKVPAETVRRAFNEILSGNLLRAAGPMHIRRAQWGYHSGESGSLRFECDGRALFDVALTLQDPTNGTTLDERVERLGGIERWTRGTMDTLDYLDARKWDFKRTSPENMAAIRKVMTSGTPALASEFARRGAPLTAERQRLLEPSERALALEIAASGDGEVLDALLRSKVRWSVEELSRALQSRVFLGDIARAEALIKAGADPKHWENLGDPVVARAASGGFPDAVQFILRYESRRDALGSALHDASHRYPREFGIIDRGQSGRDYPAIIAMLVKAGADVNARTSWDQQTPLQSARRHVDRARTLISLGADVNAQDNRGYTALTMCPSVEVATLLIEKGGDPYIRNAVGETVLTSSLARGCKPTTEFIAKWMATHGRE